MTSSKPLRRVQAKERQRQALELRKAGATYQVIADKLQYKSASGAQKAVKSALDALGNDAAEDLRVVEGERLNQMLLSIWQRVQQGDLKAIDRALRIGERIAKLNGLDAPTRSESLSVQQHVVTIDGDKRAYIEALRAARGEVIEVEALNEG